MLRTPGRSLAGQGGGNNGGSLYQLEEKPKEWDRGDVMEARGILNEVQVRVGCLGLESGM